MILTAWRVAVPLCGLLAGIGLLKAELKSQDRFQSALTLVADADYEGAKKSLEALVASEQFAPEVFLLLGNCEFRLGQLGHAAVNYRRALVLDAGHPEAAQNLGFLVDREGLLDFGQPSKPGLAQRISRAQLNTAIAGGIWLAALSIAVLLLLRQRPPWLARAAAATIALGIITSATAYAIALRRDRGTPHPDSAIVVQAQTVARSAPADGAPEIIALPAGSVVISIKQRGPWTYVDIPGELRGWVRTAALEKLWPFDPQFSG